MLAKLRVLLIAVLALVAVPETIFADDSAKVTSLEALLKQYMDENAELKRAIAEQGANDASTAVDVVVGEATPSPDGADETERLELYSSEIICERAQLNDNEYGLVVKMDAKKYADEAERRGLNCLVDKAKSCKDDLENCRKETLCKFVNAWYPGADKIYIDAAQARGLDCGVEMAVVKPEPVISCEEDPKNCDADELCKKASYGSSLKVWYVFSEQVYVDAAQARGLDCGVGKAVDKPEPVKTCEDDPKNCEADELCKKATYGSSQKFWYGFSEQVYVDAAQARGLDCGVENPATSTKASSTCENDPAYCDNSQLCEAAIKRVDSAVSWSSDPASRPYADEARKRQLACSLTFPLASCKGWNGTINVMDGLNSTKATMTGSVLAKDLREYCTRDPGGETTNYGGKLSIEQCVEKYLAQKNDPLTTTANCETGDLVFERYLNGEKKTTTVSFPLAIGTDRSCASGLMPLEYQFAMLCPTNADSDDWIAAGQQRKADAENQKADADAEEQKRLADEKHKQLSDKAAEKSKTRRFAPSQSQCNSYYFDFSNDNGLTINKAPILNSGFNFSLDMNDDSIVFSADNSTNHVEAYVNFAGGDRYIFVLSIFFNGVLAKQINEIYVECN